ncbi:MAG: ERCC4 domain-containing protein [Candidatus Aenigmatarchaeota archaeon]
MEKQLSLSKTIFVDYREKEIADILKKMGANITTINLPIGDFVAGEVCIERKSYEDFISSIIDGRIFEQAKLISESFEKGIIIIEGYGFNRINENSLYAALASLITKFRLSVLRSESKYETANLIFWIAKKEFENSKTFGYKIRKKNNSLKNIQERIVASFPGISTVLSKRILERFGSLENFFKASERELMKIDGIGEKLAKRIRKIIEEKYKVSD